MKFQLGDKIRFRYTGGKGEIIRDFLDGSYMVYDAEDRDELVAFSEDIVLESEFRYVEQSELSKKQKKQPKPQKTVQLSTEALFYSREELEQQRKTELQAKNPLPQKNVTPSIITASPVIQKSQPVKQQEPAKKLNIQPQSASDQGVFLGAAEEGRDGYVVYLINDTPNSFSFDFELVVHQAGVQRLRHTITPHTFFAIGEISHGNMAESPTLEFKIAAFNLERSIKIKQKKLLEQQKNAPLMGAALFLFVIFEGKNPPNSTGSLKDYTQKYAEKLRPKKEAESLNEVEQQAHFVVEIDLHFDKLVKSTEKFLPNEILPIQLHHAEDFLQRAEMLGLDQVFLIHGIGNGRLREALHRMLKKRETVIEFKNEWHQKYGIGATLVRFK